MASNLARALRAAAGRSDSSYSYYDSDSGGSQGIIGTIAVSALVVLVVLIVVHYTITPIFRLRPGAKGFITVPGITRDDGAIYWENTYPHGPLSEQDTLFSGTSNTSYNYTLAIDFFFTNLSTGLNTSQKLRPLFYRYNPAGTSADGVPDYSLGMFLDPAVNDIQVIVRTTELDQEVIVIKNVIAQEPIRVAAVVGEGYFEVYKNGKLVGTRRLRNPPKEALGVFWADPGSTPTGVPTTSTTVSKNPDICTEVQPSGPLGGAVNLHIWKRTLSPAELKYSTPALPAASLFKEQSQAKGGIFRMFM